ncbi:GTP-binding protein [Stutzerimonas stutzeri]|uniref:GTP-binding protein n=1 Tax=Stutzerimonas stutzeri TaxID=316 RepID=UPI0005EAD978
MSSQQKVNVGTIGHIDHGKTTLAATLAKLGAVLVRDEDLPVETAELRRLAELDDIDGDLISYPSAFGRLRRDRRKAARKARLLDLQRRAFTGEASK